MCRLSCPKLLTIHDVYAMPFITDILTRLNKKTIFSKIDLAKAFHEIPINPDDICKTPIINPSGLFEYLRMPFGISHCITNLCSMNCVDTMFGILNKKWPYTTIFPDYVHFFKISLCGSKHNDGTVLPEYLYLYNYHFLNLHLYN